LLVVLLLPVGMVVVVLWLLPTRVLPVRGLVAWVGVEGA
jgi:hypothetical protein